MCIFEKIVKKNKKHPKFYRKFFIFQIKFHFLQHFIFNFDKTFEIWNFFLLIRLYFEFLSEIG
jgi:hypothetical protein